jgi:hypothetical protein
MRLNRGRGSMSWAGWPLQPSPPWDCMPAIWERREGEPGREGLVWWLNMFFSWEWGRTSEAGDFLCASVLPSAAVAVTSGGSKHCTGSLSLFICGYDLNFAVRLVDIFICLMMLLQVDTRSPYVWCWEIMMVNMVYSWVVNLYYFEIPSCHLTN